ncbi:MAG TPA: hypothetical protein DCY13_23340, partial [Verrucomicrobiales bacterium]|nr:hypothetical protein [Verrucomicrobiales bacterium]
MNDQPIEPMNETPSTATGPVKPRVLRQLVVGVGGAGGNIAAFLQQSGMNGIAIIAANTDAQAEVVVDQ